VADALKDMYHRGFFERLAERVKAVDPAFDAAAFVDRVLADGWESLALKQRMRRAATALREGLPPDYASALDIALRTAESCGNGFEYMLFPDFVEAYGLDDPDRSVPALAALTRYSSSEFAVRPFIVRYPERMERQLLEWAEDENEHVRRLASEGSRPRLPWGTALTAYKRDPAPTLRVLEKLKEDPSEYVRRSVANHLNDISKDHPALVLDIARRWLGVHPHTDWIVKHACRTLLKKCDPDALALFGYADASGLRVDRFELSSGDRLPWEGTLEASFALTLEGAFPRKLRIEYAIDYVKSNGARSRKLFKLSEREFDPGETSMRFRQSFREMSTRRHYPGAHRVSIVVNGEILAERAFQLLAQASES